MVREQADTDAAGQIESVALDHELTGHRLPDPIRGGCRAGDMIGVNQREYKLVSSHLRHGVLCADILLQTFSDLLQKKVADRVSERVINGLKVIQIEPQYGDPFAAPASIGQPLGQPVFEKG